MGNGPMDLAIGAILLIIAAVLVFTVLPIADEAITDYAAGADGNVSDTADNPPTSQVNLAGLFPLTVIAVLVFGGVVELVRGARQLRGG